VSLRDACSDRGLQARILALDSFYTRDVVRGPSVTLSDGSTMFDFNHPDAIDSEAAIQAIDEASDAVLIVEGLFALAVDGIRDRLDTRVFVELDADLRAVRRLLRDMKGGRTSTDPEFIARFYVESARPGHARFVQPSSAYAELVVRGDAAGLASAVPALLARIRSAR